MDRLARNAISCCRLSHSTKCRSSSRLSDFVPNQYCNVLASVANGNLSSTSQHQVRAVHSDRELRWQRNFLAMKEFMERVSAIGQESTMDPALAGWLERQRRWYQLKLRGAKTPLTKERQQRIESLGISLSPLEDVWEQSYEHLCHFVKENGCFPYDLKREDLTKDEIKLFAWCKTQRKVFVRGTLCPRREEKLNAVGFLWSSHEAIWNKRYEELEEYHNHHGDCMVPWNYAPNQELADWTRAQRDQYAKYREGKPSSMNQDRVDMLSKLNFEWNVLEARWIRNYRELEDHVRINGPGSKPSISANDTLRRWLNRQLINIHAKLDGKHIPSMTNERMEMLEKLGFP